MFCAIQRKYSGDIHHIIVGKFYFLCALADVSRAEQETDVQLRLCTFKYVIQLAKCS